MAMQRAHQCKQQQHPSDAKVRRRKKWVRGQKRLIERLSFKKFGEKNNLKLRKATRSFKWHFGAKLMYHRFWKQVCCNGIQSLNRHHLAEHRHPGQ
ncbi:MAG: hypothetical protein EAY75_07090 [Bacteroidetes bacterium]|nr:MAG: hypothetical protein EAY75_07090 [Bacteroidota bacterium]